MPPQQARFIQPKLEINTPGDKYEQEADAMADRVMRMADTGTSNHSVSSLIGPSVQRKCAECEEEEQKENPLMRKAENGGYGMQAPSSLVSSLNSSKGGGAPLPQGTRNFMESAFSADFSRVRVHTGGQASDMSGGINARAFTHGNDIYFKGGQYAPNNEAGKKLLAHELTHTIQQGGLTNNTGKKSVDAHIQRKPTVKVEDENFIGPLNTDERRANLSCPIYCDGLTNMGTLNVMGLFYHKNNSIDATPTAGDDGVGTAIHFQSSGPQPLCKCDSFKIIQVIKTTRPAPGRNGDGYVDNKGQNTPFYGDVYFSGTGEHKIPPNYPDAGERIRTTHSIYDRPEKHTAGVNATIMWQAEACVACIRSAKPDIIFGGVTYGFTIPFDKGTNTFGTIQGIGPQCLSGASSHFESTLRTDPTTSNYDFKVDYGLGDFNIDKNMQNMA